MPQALLLFVPQGSLLTQMNTGIFETTTLPTLTLPKAKVKAKAKARARKGRVKDQAKEKANLKAKKIVPLPLPPLSSPLQPKEKARNNHTTHPPPCFLLSGPACHCGTPSVLPVISPLSAHPNGPACHCGRSRRVPNTPNPLPSHLYTQPSVNPVFWARLVIVAGPALHPTPLFTSIPLYTRPQSPPLLRPGLSLWQVPPHQYPPTPFSPLLPFSLTCFSPQPPSSYPSFGPACHCGRSRPVPLLTLLALLPFWIPHSILCHSFGPACHCGGPRLPIPTAYHFNSFYHSHLLPLLKARLVIVAGPA